MTAFVHTRTPSAAPNAMRENTVNPPCAALHFENVRFTYSARRRQSARQAVNGVTMTIHQGQTVALLGPNGSGKSTLIRMLCGLAVPDTGSIELLGSSKLRTAAMSVVFQSSGLDKHMTVYENLRDQAALYGLQGDAARSHIDSEMNIFEIADRRDDRVGTLSGGLARRVDLCRALLHQPKVLVLDEPTVGLDPTARQSFLDILHQRSTAQSMTLLMTTHLIDEADRCERVVMMHEGSIVGDACPHELRSSVGQRRISVEGDQLPNLDGLSWTGAGGRYVADLNGDEECISGIAAQLAREGVSFSIAPPTLADVFEQLTGRSLGKDSDEAPP